MTKEIVVSHGLCSAIRPKVLTALKPYNFKDLRVAAWAEGHVDPVTFKVTNTDKPTSDDDKWATKHYARIMVSDDAAGWAEWLLWQSGNVMLESEPHPKYAHLVWTAPKGCKDQTGLGRGKMPTPWSKQEKGKTQKAKATKRTTAAKQPAKRKAKPKAQGRKGLSGALQIRR